MRPKKSNFIVWRFCRKESRINNRLKKGRKTMTVMFFIINLVLPDSFNIQMRHHFKSYNININHSQAKFLNNNKERPHEHLKIARKEESILLYQLDSQLCHWFYRDRTTTTCTCLKHFTTHKAQHLS